jgi:hypothetical protein
LLPSKKTIAFTRTANDITMGLEEMTRLIFPMEMPIRKAEGNINR